MLWKDMLEKHENAFAAFESAKMKEWEELHKSGQPRLEQVEQFQKNYTKDYNRFVKTTFTEALFTYQKEQINLAHTRFVRAQAREHPEVEYFQKRAKELIQDKEPSKDKSWGIDKDDR